MKIAGSSFEMAFARYCGTDDIITPLEANKRAKKQKRFGHNKGQNYKSPHEYNIRHNKIISMEPRAFAEHYPADRIKKYLPKEIWDSYLKVSIVRCPYDTLISYYYWICRFPAKKPDSFESYAIDSGIDRVLENYHKLHIKRKLATDFLIRFENFDEDIKKLEDLIDCNGLLDTFKNIRAKSDLRPDTEESSVTKVYSEYPTAKIKLDEALSEKFNRYELLQKYWQFYKSKLEEDLHRSHVITKTP